MEASHPSAPSATATSQRLLTGAVLLNDRLRTAIHSLASPGLTRVMIAAG